MVLVELRERVPLGLGVLGCSGNPPENLQRVLLCRGGTREDRRRRHSPTASATMSRYSRATGSVNRSRSYFGWVMVENASANASCCAVAAYSLRPENND